MGGVPSKFSLWTRKLHPNVAGGGLMSPGGWGAWFQEGCLTGPSVTASQDNWRDNPNTSDRNGLCSWNPAEVPRLAEDRVGRGFSHGEGLLVKCHGISFWFPSRIISDMPAQVLFPARFLTCLFLI